jgi:hypothetical protein
VRRRPARKLAWTASSEISVPTHCMTQSLTRTANWGVSNSLMRYQNRRGIRRCRYRSTLGARYQIICSQYIEHMISISHTLPCSWKPATRGMTPSSRYDRTHIERVFLMYRLDRPHTVSYSPGLSQDRHALRLSHIWAPYQVLHSDK